MAKIKELLAGREKLAKYDELTKWKEKFESGTVVMDFWEVVGNTISMDIKIPDHIKEIIVAALDAEIKKLDEE